MRMFNSHERSIAAKWIIAMPKGTEATPTESGFSHELPMRGFREETD